MVFKLMPYFFPISPFECYFLRAFKKERVSRKTAFPLMNFSNRPFEKRPVYEGASSVYR